MTNYEKYFGTPELAMRSTYDDSFMASQTNAFRRWASSTAQSDPTVIARAAHVLMSSRTGKTVAKLYLEWLVSEVEDGTV